MGEEETNKGEEVPEVFKEAIDYFLDNKKDTLEYLHVINSDYLFGRDIRESLRRFRILRPEVFRLVLDVMSGEDFTDKWLHMIDEDKIDEIYEVKKYSDVLSEMIAVMLEEYGLDHLTNIRRAYKSNPDILSPIIELKLMTGTSEIISLKLTPLNIQGLAGVLVSYVNECLVELGKEMDKSELNKIIESVRDLEEDQLPELKETLEILRGDE